MKEELKTIICEGVERRIFTNVDLSVKLPSQEVLHLSFSDGILHEKYERRLFDIASITKMVLTLLVYRLLTIGENKKFTLDAPVKRFIDISGPHTDELTIHHLLTFHATFNTFITPAEMWRRIEGTPGLGRLLVFPDMFSQIKSVGLTGRPGLECKYANIHAILLGLVLESAFGKNLEELMKKYLFAPLGFRDTTTNPLGKLKRCVKAQHDVPHGKVSDPVARLSLHVYSRLLGSAGLFSTTEELLELLNLVLLGEQHPTCPISDTFVNNLHLPVTDKRDFGQGFGLWSKFLESLEAFHPNPPDDMIFRSGFSGALCACSKSKGKSIAFATDFLYVYRTVDEMKVARRGLHETYARVGHCVFG